MTAFINQNNTKSKVSFASPIQGKLFQLIWHNLKIHLSEDSFLCAAKGVSVGIEFSKKLGTGLFGGEGFIMQKRRRRICTHRGTF
jgi:uncharacterized protein (AIM24 family)